MIFEAHCFHIRKTHMYKVTVAQVVGSTKGQQRGGGMLFVNTIQGHEV